MSVDVTPTPAMRLLIAAGALCLIAGSALAGPYLRIPEPVSLRLIGADL